IESEDELIGVVHDFVFVGASTIFWNEFRHQMQSVEILHDVALLVGDDEHVERFDGLVEVANGVGLNEGVLLLEAHELRESSQQSLDSDSAHLYEESGDQSFTGLSAHGSSKNHLFNKNETKSVSQYFQWHRRGSSLEEGKDLLH